MKHTSLVIRLLLAGWLVGPAPGFGREPVPPAAPDAKGVEFFEARIRPVLAEHCYACHSAGARAQKKLRGGCCWTPGMGCGAAATRGLPSSRGSLRRGRC